MVFHCKFCFKHATSCFQFWQAFNLINAAVLGHSLDDLVAKTFPVNAEKQVTLQLIRSCSGLVVDGR